MIIGVKDVSYPSPMLPPATFVVNLTLAAKPQRGDYAKQQDI